MWEALGRAQVVRRGEGETQVISAEEGKPYTYEVLEIG